MTKSEIIWMAIQETLNEERDGFYGIIEEFLHYEMNNYKEPTRRGTPKGEKVGFSSKKHFACILVGITNYKLKYIAKKSDVSYGMLRKWNTDPNFTDEANYIAFWFVIEIFRRIKKYISGQQEAAKKYFDGQGKDPFAKRDPDRPLDDFERILRDAPDFSDTALYILNKLLMDLEQELKNLQGDDWVDYIALSLRLLDILLYSKTKKIGITPPNLARHMVSEVKNIISEKRKISSQEQRIILNYLTLTENALRDYQYEFLALYEESLPKGRRREKLDEFCSKMAEFKMFDFKKGVVESHEGKEPQKQ
jgi:hypothetical protein